MLRMLLFHWFIYFNFFLPVFQQPRCEAAVLPVLQSPEAICSARGHQTRRALRPYTWMTSWRWKRAGLSQPDPPGTTNCRGTLSPSGAAGVVVADRFRIAAVRDPVPDGDREGVAEEEEVVGLVDTMVLRDRVVVSTLEVVEAVAEATVTIGSSRRTTLGRPMCGPAQGGVSTGTEVDPIRGRIKR